MTHADPQKGTPTDGKTPADRAELARMLCERRKTDPAATLAALAVEYRLAVSTVWRLTGGKRGPRRPARERRSAEEVEGLYRTACHLGSVRRAADALGRWQYRAACRAVEDYCRATGQPHPRQLPPEAWIERAP